MGFAGRVCLLFFENQTEPQVWFQDLGCTWNFVAGTFTEYFRVLVLYLGLAHWQYAFTKVLPKPLLHRSSFWQALPSALHLCVCW